MSKKTKLSDIVRVKIGRSKEKFSAEEILLGIYLAKRNVARTRPKKTPLEEGETPLSDRELFEEQIRFDKYLNCFIEPDSEEYISARNDLSRWNARARRFCSRRMDVENLFRRS